MSFSEQDKIKVAREYFIRADQRRVDILDLFNEDAEIYFPKFGFGFGRQSFFEMVKGFEGILENIQHDCDTMILQEVKLLADVSATCLNFETNA